MTPSLLTALCKPLTAVRPAIVDPACGDGELLHAAANTDRDAPPPYIGTEHLLGLAPDHGLAASAAGVTGSNLKLWQARYDDPALPELLSALNITWDCVVTRVSNPVDAVGLWTLIHSRLSKRGEGMVLAMNPSTASSLSSFIVHPSSFPQRVWLEVELPSGETAFYFAADHKPNPGDTPERRAPANEVDATLELAGAFANRRRFIRGNTVEAFHQCQPQAGARFFAAEDEWNRRKGKRKSDWNILLSSEGRLVVSLTPFQKLVELNVNRTALMALHGKDPMDMVVQRPTRLALQGMVRSDELRVHAAVTVEIDRCVREYSAQRAPFTRLNDVQRLGYLDEEDSVKSTATNLGFTAGRSYKMWTTSEETNKEDHRLRDDGKNEKVMVRGQELVVRVMDDEGVAHAFRQHPRDGLHEHSLAEFVQTFEIPDVPDVADCRPDRYAENKKQLLALEKRK
jgi:hypothetical protein